MHAEAYGTAVIQSLHAGGKHNSSRSSSQREGGCVGKTYRVRGGAHMTFRENSTSKMLKNDTFLFGSHPQNASFGKVKQNIQNKKWTFLKMFLVCNLKKTSFA